MNVLGQCTYSHLDPAYAPPLAIDRIPSTAQPTTPKTDVACGGQAPSGWVCVFADEFSGSALGGTWTQQLTKQGTTGFPSEAGAACFDGSAQNVNVAGGSLNLAVTKGDAFTCEAGNKDFSTRFRGGGVFSKVLNGKGFNQTYGRFDMRVALPAATQPGLQSALWLWPENDTYYGAWPASGEIDLAEYYTERPGFIVPTLHYNANTAEKSGPKGINTTQNAFCHFDTPSQFHTYTLIWEPSLISVYYDGTLCLFDHYKPTGIREPAPFDRPFFLALTAALGLGGTSNAAREDTQLPGTTRVDWVRVFKAGTAPAPAAVRTGTHRKARTARRAKLRRHGAR
jgi:beta-glucanase (GH16 family)